MNCLILPSYVMKRRRGRAGPRLAYRRLNKSGFVHDDAAEGLVRVVVGKEKREFFVDPFVLEETPFRVLIEKGGEDENENENGEIWREGKRRVVFVDVDAILFEHLLWLMYNDCSSLFNLNVEEILDFYSQDF